MAVICPGCRWGWSWSRWASKASFSLHSWSWLRALTRMQGPRALTATRTCPHPLRGQAELGTPGPPPSSKAPSRGRDLGRVKLTTGRAYSGWEAPSSTGVLSGGLGTKKHLRYWLPADWSAQFYVLLICAVQMLPVAVMEWTMRQAQSPWSVTGGSEPDVETVMRVLWLCLPRSGSQTSLGIPWHTPTPCKYSIHSFNQ